MSFTMIHNDILENTLLNMREKICFVVLQKFADNETHTCFPSLNKLAAIIGCSKPTVIKALKGLEEKGLILKKRRKRADGGHTSNLYTILVSAIDKISDKKNTKEKEPSPRPKLDGSNYNTKVTLKERLSYNSIISDMPEMSSTVEVFFEYLEDTMNSTKKAFYINKEMIPATKVKEKLSQLDFFDMKYAIDKFCEVTENKSIRKKKEYIISLLYNAKAQYKLEMDELLRQTDYGYII